MMTQFVLYLLSFLQAAKQSIWEGSSSEQQQKQQQRQQQQQQQRELSTKAVKQQIGDTRKIPGKLWEEGN